ncbi:hypothetical protein ACQ4PT_058009 [Festuca glaucescens]
MPLPRGKARKGCRSRLEREVEVLQEVLRGGRRRCTPSSTTRSTTPQSRSPTCPTLPADVRSSIHPSIHPLLPPWSAPRPDECACVLQAQELLASISAMEASVTKLEEEMLAPALPPHPGAERAPPRRKNTLLNSEFNPWSFLQDTASVKPSRGDKVHPCAAAPKLHRQLSSQTLAGGADPSHLSEDIVRCMRNIFISLSDSRRASSSNTSSAAETRQQRSAPSPSGSGISAFWSLSEPLLHLLLGAEPPGFASCPSEDKGTEEHKKFCISAPEPLLTFALSCGMYSSPAVKIYTASNVREELQDAQRDFIRASVGVSRKGKLLIPKMLHCFARGFVDDNSFPIWISHFLPQQQATFVEHCVSRRRQSLLGTRTFGIIPFDSRFRYLFLPDMGSLN